MLPNLHGILGVEVRVLACWEVNWLWHNFLNDLDWLMDLDALDFIYIVNLRNLLRRKATIDDRLVV